MRRALELYYCDILEFHYNALQFLSRPGEFLHVLFSLESDKVDSKRMEKALQLFLEDIRNAISTYSGQSE